MNNSRPSSPLPKLPCQDCKQPMRVLTFVPASNGFWDLSYKCDQCGEITGVVHKPEIEIGTDSQPLGYWPRS